MLQNSVDPSLHFHSMLPKEERFTTFGHTPKEYDVLFVGGSSCVSEANFENISHLRFETVQEALVWLMSLRQKGRQLPKVMVCDTIINEKSTIIEIKQLKALDQCPEIRIIFLTAQYSQTEMQKSIAAGADDYFSSDLSCADLFMRINFLLKLTELTEVEVEDSELVKKDLKPKFWGLKRVFDVAVSFTLLLITSPILVIIAIAIKLDSRGPIFYTSKRAGKGYQIFDFYKFRTMKKDADQMVNEMLHLNQYGESESTESVFFKVKNDPRITRLGNFLRKTSLDELPQLINVLRGDMSLVGNRPLPLYEAEKLTQDQWALRFLAPAGITGLWQVSKRGKAEMSEEERVNLDMEYAQNNSFFYDLRIMLKTPTALLQKEQV
ncbi:MAG: sugar transferase [Bacteroidota bacterium]